jgi:hypothetical protein
MIMKTRLLFLLLLFVPLISRADESGQCGKNLTYTYVEATKTLSISGTGDMNNYSSPSNQPWSQYRSEILVIKIGDEVTSIGQYAFNGCSGLTSVTIGKRITSIGYYAFTGCSSLTSVTLLCKEVGAWFNENTLIKEVILGNEVTTIGNSAFSGCSGLTSITIPNSVIVIGESAFAGCEELTVYVPKGTLNRFDKNKIGALRLMEIN